MSRVKSDAMLAYHTGRNMTTTQDKIFYKSNENIVDLINYFDFDGKSVLTVAGSGDQVFHFLNSNASSVEVYDKNILTKYYYYFRVWCIRYLNKFYPPAGFDVGFIKQLLSIAEPLNSDEIDAYEFWIEYIKLLGNSDNSLMRYDIVSYDNTLTKLKSLKEKILNPLDFHILNLTCDINLSKKYDVIYVSNIRDWIWILSAMERIKYKDNLFNLLNDDGIVICSTLDYFPAGLDEEISVFKEQFSIDYISGRYDSDVEAYRYSPGYYYKKR